ncbi:MAG: hypothetical protein IKL04_06370 [Lachnospiraceae bacterium]|nr:hypothetical protein [Lachnospiraceae bacterium]
MKKGLWVLVICLSLCLTGCGQNKYEEYDFLLEMLEEGEYDEAHEVINRLSDGEESAGL